MTTGQPATCPCENRASFSAPTGRENGWMMSVWRNCLFLTRSNEWGFKVKRNEKITKQSKGRQWVSLSFPFHSPTAAVKKKSLQLLFWGLNCNPGGWYVRLLKGGRRTEAEKAPPGQGEKLSGNKKAALRLVSKCPSALRQCKNENGKKETKLLQRRKKE